MWAKDSGHGASGMERGTQRRSVAATIAVWICVMLACGAIPFLVDLPTWQLIPLCMIIGTVLGTWTVQRIALHAEQAYADYEAAVAAHYWARSHDLDVVPSDCRCPGCEAAE